MKKVLLSVAVVALMGLSSCGGASLCDCINMDEMNEECKTMKKEWKAKYEKASDEEKEKMQAEAEACEKEKEGKEEEGGH